MLLHGIAKFNGIDGLMGLFEKNGMPGFFAYAVYIGEVVAPLMMIIGWRARLGGLLVAFTMFVAVLLRHMDDIMTLTKTGGWGIELQALYFFGAIAVYFLGAGRFSASLSNKWD